jgi:hypothetical protein
MKWTVGVARNREFYPSPEGTIMYVHTGHIEMIMGGANSYHIEADSEEEARYRALSEFYNYRADFIKRYKLQEVNNYKRKIGLSAE